MSERKSNHYYFNLAAGMAFVPIAGVVRFIGYDSESLWRDEVTTIGRLHQPLGAMFSALAEAGQAPAHYLLLKIWATVFGYSRLALLAPNILFGMGTALAAWAIARRIFSARAGTYAAALTALSPMLVSQSQEIRMYALTPFLAAALFYFFLRSLDSPKALGMLGLTALSLGLSHNVAALAPAAMIPIIIFDRKRPLPRRILIAATLSAAILFLAIVIMTMSGHDRYSVAFGYPYVGPLSRLASYLLFFGPSYTSGYTLQHEYNLAAYFSLGAAIIGLPLLWSFYKGIRLARKNQGRPVADSYLLLLASALLIGGFLPLFVEPKYLMFTYPIVYVLIAGGLDGLRRNSVSLALFLAIIFLFSQKLYERNERIDIMQWRAAAEQLTRETKADELVIPEHRHEFETLGFYYRGHAPLIDPLIPGMAAPSAITETVAGIWIPQNSSPVMVRFKQQTGQSSALLSWRGSKVENRKAILALYPDCATTQYHFIDLLHCRRPRQSVRD